MESKKTSFDLIIIGGSAAAATAGIYAARRGLDFHIITKDFGGEVATSGVIENWPGTIHTDGLTLADQFKKHLAVYNVVPEEGVAVSSITKQADGLFCISVNQDGETMAADKVKAVPEVYKCDYVAKAVIVATGVHPKRVNVPGEEEFRNKGVTYCTTCDGPLFQDKITTVIGGGNSALESALMLADIASQVYIINKSAQFKGEQVLIDKVSNKKNIQIIYLAKTTEIKGEQLVNEIVYTDSAGVSQNLKTDGVFIHIGMVPNSGIVSEDVLKDQFGQII